MTTFLDRVIESRRNRELLNQERNAELAEGQAAYEAAEAKRQAEWERRRGPKVAPEELARRDDDQAAEIGRLRALLAQLPAEESALVSVIVEAVRHGDLEGALGAVTRRAALEPVRGAIATRFHQLGLGPDGRVRGPMR